jgi:hypothetical protein
MDNETTHVRDDTHQPYAVIAYDKREAFAQGSVSDEAIHFMPHGLLRSRSQ